MKIQSKYLTKISAAEWEKKKKQEKEEQKKIIKLSDNSNKAIKVLMKGKIKQN